MRVAILVVIALFALAVAVAKAFLPPRVDAPPTPRELAIRVLGGAAAAATPSAGRPIFTDIAAATGLDFVHDNDAEGAFLLPEQMGPGAAFLDYDDDGDLDVFIAGGGSITGDGPGQTCRLFRSAGGRFEDVTEAAGAGVPGPAYGVACADVDDDGDVDVYVSRLGPNALLRNEGDGRFTEVGREAGVDDDGFGASCVFLDYDRDGRLDLYVANYVGWTIEREGSCYTILGERDYCNPVVYRAPSTDVLYRGRGDGTFENVSAAAGIALARGNGLGVLATDFDDDGWIDLYVANDQTPALLWHNSGDGTFENIAPLAGCAYDGRGVAIAGMGVAGQDLDADGDPDLIVTNIDGQANLVLRNDDGFFQDVSDAMGTRGWSVPLTTFGVVLFDQDHDGRLDGYFANGDVNRDNPLATGDNPYEQPDQFVRLAAGRFTDATTAAALPPGGVGRGVASGDIDGDGDLDLLVTDNGGPVRLLRNDQGGDGRWLIVDAHTGPGGRAAIGARLTLVLSGPVLVREIRPQDSYLSSHDPRAHFGLAGERIERLEIRWPDGTRSVHRDLGVNQVVVIEQPSEEEDRP